MMLGRDESMPNVDPNADMSSGDRDIARALAIDILERDVDLSKIPPRLVALMARAVVRYVPASVPESAPHAVAAADDRTRPAVTTGPEHIYEHGRSVLTGDPLPDQPYTGSPALDFPAPGVICAPIEPESSNGVCEVSDDGSTSQNRLNLTAVYDAATHDITRKG